MIARAPHISSAIGLALLGAACTPTCGDCTGEAPQYLGVETRLLDDDMVSFQLRMLDAQGPEDVAEYGECAAAQYALIRGYGFARHVRTSVSQEGGVWLGDAVYLVSPGLPKGLLTIDAEVTVQNCNENGIPTV